MQKFYAGIDVGTYYVKAVVAAPPEHADGPMQILATATSVSKGVRHGYVVDVREAARSIRDAVIRASQAARIPVKHARVSVGGLSLEEVRSSADITLTASSGIVTPHEIERVLAESEKRASARLANRVVVHVIPLEYRLDGIPVQGRPLGLQGTKLSADTLLVTMLAQHHDDMIEAVEAAGVEVEGVMAAPLSASLVTLSKAQKTAGVVLANIGAETLSIVVFDEDVPISLKVFSSGSSDITEKIALSFQLPLSEAEQLKRGAVTGSSVPPGRLSTAVNTQLKEMFSLVNAHLKSIKRDRLLPAGIVITGGGASTPSVTDIARTTLKLPSQVGLPAMSARVSTLDATWAVALGLCRWGYAEDRMGRHRPLADIVERMLDAIKNAFRSLLP